MSRKTCTAYARRLRGGPRSHLFGGARFSAEGAITTYLIIIKCNYRSDASGFAELNALHTRGDIVAILESGCQATARRVNAVMTATYWGVGRRVVEFEQGGENRAAYGQALLVRLSGDLTKRIGRGFGVGNLELMRLFYQTYSPAVISESSIRKFRRYESTPEFRISDLEI